MIETSDIKEKELMKLREETETIRMERDRANNELRVSVGNPRSSNLATSRIGGGPDDKKKVRELELLLEAKHVDLSIERKKLIN